MRSPRSVTIVPTGWPLRTLNCAIDFLARRVTGFWPVTRASSSAPVSMILTFEVASPSPMLTTTLVIFGTAIDVRVAELFRESRNDVLLVLVSQAAHLSTTPSHLRQIRTLRPSPSIL